MSRFVKVTIIAVISVLALGLAFAAGTVVTTKVASAAAGMDGLFHGGRGGPGDRVPFGGDRDQYLADALGITAEELQTAYQTAQDAALAQAVEQGLLTQEQADAIKARSDDRGGRGGFPHGFGRLGPDGASIDFDALLADALNITVEELQAARQTAENTALETAVTNGDLTQEQADLIRAHQALRNTIDREALTAGVLDMSVEDLQAARQEGKTLEDLLAEKGLTQAEFQEAMQAAHEAAVAQAVADGVITQAQADQILSDPRGGFDGPFGGGHGGRGGRMGPGGPMGPGGECPPPATTPAPTDGTSGTGA